MLSGPIGRTIRLLGAEGPSPHYRSEAWLIPGLTVNMVHASQMGMTGSGSLNGRDDLYLNIPLDSFSYRVTQAGRDVVAAQGCAATSLSAEAYTVTSGGFAAQPGEGRALTLVIDRALLRDLVRNEDSMVAGYVAPSTPALPLLISYVTALSRIDDALPPQLARTVARHSAELVALALGPSAHAREAAHDESLGAARLVHAQRYIAENLADPQLSEEKLSRLLGVSVSSIRKDFERSGQSLGRYVREQRIRKAAALLSDPRAFTMKIIDIAFLSGFSDISTFNRAFARQFGCSPREFRAERTNKPTPP
ncbi:hypothetical protein BRAO375_2450005 [Bradyrhizobium sp. ORS 375]|nr:hypothetical protein BRAO375_2450005 [Bradyrhizobium sp. ORS 375]